MKVFLFFLILFFSSCFKNTSYELKRVSSNDYKYRSSRLRFPDSNYKEMELEILFLSDSIKCYLNFYRNTIKKEDERVVVLTDDKQIEAECICLKGKQRLLLADILNDIIMDTLKKGKKISIIHNKSTINIDQQDFSTAYQKAIKKKSLISTFINSINR